MPKIAKVTPYEGDPNNLLIELDNGSCIFLDISTKQNIPLFSEIKELALPKTDGERVYWHNGASLTITEIFELVEDGMTQDKPDGICKKRLTDNFSR